MTEDNFGSSDSANPGSNNSANGGGYQQPPAQGNWGQNQNPNASQSPYGQPYQQAPQQNWGQQPYGQPQGQNAYGAPQGGYQNQPGFNQQGGQAGQFDIKKYLDFSNKSVLWLVCAAAASLVTFIGSFMPWAKITAPYYGNISVSGTNGDGVLTLLLAIIAIGYIAAALFIPALIQKWWRAIPVIVVGALLLLIALVDWADIGGRVGDVDSDVVDISVGSGLVLILLASIALIAFSVLALLNDKKLAPAKAQQALPQQGFGQQPQQPQNNFGPQSFGQQPQQPQNNFGQAGYGQNTYGQQPQQPQNGSQQASPKQENNDE